MRSITWTSPRALRNTPAWTWIRMLRWHRRMRTKISSLRNNKKLKSNHPTLVFLACTRAGSAHDSWDSCGIILSIRQRSAPRYAWEQQSMESGENGFCAVYPRSIMASIDRATEAASVADLQLLTSRHRPQFNFQFVTCDKFHLGLTSPRLAPCLNRLHGRLLP